MPLHSVWTEGEIPANKMGVLTNVRFLFPVYGGGTVGLSAVAWSRTFESQGNRPLWSGIRIWLGTGVNLATETENITNPQLVSTKAYLKVLANLGWLIENLCVFRKQFEKDGLAKFSKFRFFSGKLFFISLFSFHWDDMLNMFLKHKVPAFLGQRCICLFLSFSKCSGFLGHNDSGKWLLNCCIQIYIGFLL